MAITNKNLRLLAERESDRLLQEHQASGKVKSLLKLSNGFQVLFEDDGCQAGCAPSFEVLEIDGKKVLVRLCKRPDGSICV